MLFHMLVSPLDTFMVMVFQCLVSVLLCLWIIVNNFDVTFPKLLICVIEGIH